MKNMSRSVRRHHIQRLKAKRRFQWGRDYSSSPRWLGILTHTSTPCSCWACGNERKWKTDSGNGLTLQERSFYQTQKWDD